MHGFLDELHQSFLTLDIGQGPLDFLVDTGFAGTLVIGEELLDPTNAEWVGESEADLAAGQTQLFDLYEIEFLWLGQPTRTTAFVVQKKVSAWYGTAQFPRTPNQLSPSNHSIDRRL